MNETDYDDDQDYSDESYYFDDDAEVIDCPSCGAEVYEDTPRCPACGDYIIASTNYVWADRPRWWIVLGAVGILATVAMMTLA